MRAVLLPVLFVLGVGSATAAPCDILPYTNQCQGSNLWPVPAGWTADNNGDCQPQYPAFTYTPAHLGYIQSGTGGGPWATVDDLKVATGKQAWTFKQNTFDVMPYEYWGGACNSGTVSYDYPGALILDPGPLHPNCGHMSYNRRTQQLMHWPMCFSGDTLRGRTAGDVGVVGGTPVTGYTYFDSVMRPNVYWRCQKYYNSSSMKPSDGVCTARWTSSAQTALQKDGLDPDCDADSCVIDGTCRLR